MEQTVQSLIKAVDEADSSEKLVNAVRALAQVRDEAAIATLTTVLRYNNPGAAVAAVNGLINLGEVAVPYLLENIDGYNYGARAWATCAFAGIGDPRALDVLLDATANDFAFSVRRAAAKGLGNLNWDKLSGSEAFPKQQQVLSALISAAKETEWVVRYAAIAGLQAFATKLTSFRPEVINQLTELSQSESEFIVQSRIAWALDNLQN